MMRLSSFTVIIAFIAVALGGLALAPFLTVRLFPSDTMPAMTVSYVMPGSSSRIIEGEVTGKLEGLITGVAGVKEVRSSSRNGSGDITVSFDRHCDLAMARFEIVSIIRQAWEHLPQGVSYPTVTMHLPDAERSRLLISYTINSYASPIDIQRYCEEYIKPALADIDGVESVSIYGAQPLEWRLMLDFNKATRLGISMEEIRKAITSSSDSRIIGEGRLNSPDDEKQRILLEVDTPEDSLLLQLPIKLVDNRLVRLRDIASLEHAEKTADRHYRVNGRNSVYVNIAADQSANQVALAKEVRAEVERLQNRIPDGYSA
ncbi:MAG: efflux RND transporter permease subunit, partial [Muribaculaceae bacterium]|nr:efflux RND transporter permease subunit [Muribaculaceae bacterium]